MRKQLPLIMLIACTLICLVFTLWNYFRTPKIAFVRSVYVVENYLGMKEARTVFDQKTKTWNKNIDTLLLLYNNEVKYLKENKAKLSQSATKKIEENIAKKEDDLKRYNAEVENMAKEENEKLTQGALNQINSFVERYAKDHNIDIVIGVTLSGNVLYGADKIDITKEILEGLNASYK
jgi:outer membrane protein